MMLPSQIAPPSKKRAPFGALFVLASMANLDAQHFAFFTMISIHHGIPQMFPPRNGLPQKYKLS